MSDKAKPAHKIRNRALTVTIWKNDSEKGPWYSVTPSRSYKAGNDSWKESNSFGVDDLLPLAKLLDQAHTWIVNTEQAERQPSPEGIAQASKAA
jgi:hypothetical protein